MGSQIANGDLTLNELQRSKSKPQYEGLSPKEADLVNTSSNLYRVT